MANSTFYNTVNRVLEHAGQQPYTSTSDFGAGEKIQVQAVRFVDKANRRIARNNRARQRLRKFTLTLASGDNDYTLNSTTSLENLKQDSFFITTTGIARGPLKYISYGEWLKMNPTGSESTEGIPVYWFDYPPDGTTVGDRIGFSPPPDRTMTVQYEGYLDVSPLTTHSQEIALDDQFEDIIWDFGQMYLEECMSEGKAANLAAILDRLESEIRQLTLGPRDRNPRVKIGMRITGIPRCTDYRYPNRSTLGSD